MKKNFVYVAAFSLVLSVSLSGCGGSDGSQMDTNMDTEMVDESTEEAESVDISSFDSAEDAMDEYKSMMEEYADLIESGSKEEAAALKAKLDELKTLSLDKWGESSLGAMMDLSKFVLDIEAGKDINLDDAFKAYDKSMDALKNMPAVDAETEEAMKGAKDAMKQLEGMGGF